MIKLSKAQADLVVEAWNRFCTWRYIVNRMPPFGFFPYDCGVRAWLAARNRKISDLLFEGHVGRAKLLMRVEGIASTGVAIKHPHIIPLLPKITKEQRNPQSNWKYVK